MGCGCGGAKTGLSTLAKQTRKAQPGVQWEVVYPSGTTTLFDAEWQADQAIAMAGGRKRRITTGPAPTEQNGKQR